MDTHRQFSDATHCRLALLLFRSRVDGMQVQVLVIEDDGPLRAEILDFLVRRRHRVTGCATLAEATEALATTKPDAILCDIRLPDGDGITFCVNNAPRLPGVMWLLMSGNHDLVRLGNQLKGLKADMPSYTIVDKPVPLRLLDRFIQWTGHPQ
jgi:DNA-binding NtrC family response regulator